MPEYNIFIALLNLLIAGLESNVSNWKGYIHTH